MSEHISAKTRSRSDTVGQERVRTNPIYDTGDQEKVDNTYSVPFDKPEPEPSHKFDAGVKKDDVYSVPFDKPELESSHKFVNPIYGDEAAAEAEGNTYSVPYEGNTYSVPYDFSTRHTHTQS